MPPYALEQGFLSKLAHYKISRRKEKAEWLPVQEVSQLRGAWILVPFYNSIGQCNIMWCIHAFCPSSSIKFQFGPPKSKGLGTSAPERHHLTSSFAPSSLFTMAATGCCPWIEKDDFQGQITEAVVLLGSACSRPVKNHLDAADLWGKIELKMCMYLFSFIVLPTGIGGSSVASCINWKKGSSRRLWDRSSWHNYAILNKLLELTVA